MSVSRNQVYNGDIELCRSFFQIRTNFKDLQIIVLYSFFHSLTVLKIDFVTLFMNFSGCSVHNKSKKLLKQHENAKIERRTSRTARSFSRTDEREFHKLDYRLSFYIHQRERKQYNLG